MFAIFELIIAWKINCYLEIFPIQPTYHAGIYSSQTHAAHDHLVRYKGR